MVISASWSDYGPFREAELRNVRGRKTRCDLRSLLCSMTNSQLYQRDGGWTRTDRAGEPRSNLIQGLVRSIIVFWLCLVTKNDFNYPVTSNNGDSWERTVIRLETWWISWQPACTRFPTKLKLQDFAWKWKRNRICCTRWGESITKGSTKLTFGSCKPSLRLRKRVLFGAWTLRLDFTEQFSLSL